MGGICSTSKRVEDSLNDLNFNSKWTYKGVIFENGTGDICDLEVDAIVNATNGKLVHNSGLSSSIVVRGGEVIQEESNKIIESRGALNVGTAVATSAGLLQAEHIIHVVIPIWTGGGNYEKTKLEKCVKNVLARADRLDVKSIAFPSLTSGVFGFPSWICAETMITKCIEYMFKTTRYNLFRYLEENLSITSLQRIKFVNKDAMTVEILKGKYLLCKVKAFKVTMENLLGQKDIAEEKDSSETIPSWPVQENESQDCDEETRDSDAVKKTLTPANVEPLIGMNGFEPLKKN